MKATEATAEDVREKVRERYGATATGDSSCGNDYCANTSSDGYSAEDATAAPEAASLGLGCGNPLAIASLQPGQTVLDLGSGAGFDCFLAARAFGPLKLQLVGPLDSATSKFADVAPAPPWFHTARHEDA